MRFVLSLAVLFLLGSRAWAVEFLEIQSDDKPIQAALFRPAGDGPFPAIIAVHDCDGLKGQQGEFYMPTWQDDLSLTLGAAMGSSALVVPGTQISEIFPRTARHADKFSIVRSVYHTAAAVHDTGHQMMQTGRLFSGGLESPHVGCVLEFIKGRKTDLPASVIIPEKMGPTGGNLPHGQDAGFLGKQFFKFT